MIINNYKYDFKIRHSRVFRKYNLLINDYLRKTAGRTAYNFPSFCIFFKAS